MKFSKIVAALSLVLGTGVAFADDVDPGIKADQTSQADKADAKTMKKSGEKSIKKEATLGSATVNKRACKSAEVFFKFDSAALAPADDQVLQPLVDQVTKYQGTTIVLDGFTDPRGSDAYNVVLSGQRSEAVRDRLISMGAPKERIVLSLHGKTGDQRASYPEDRRVTAWVTRNTTAQIVDHALENGSQALVFGDQMRTIAELHNAGRGGAQQAARAGRTAPAAQTPPAAQTQPEPVQNEPSQQVQPYQQQKQQDQMQKDQKQQDQIQREQLEHDKNLDGQAPNPEKNSNVSPEG